MKKDARAKEEAELAKIRAYAKAKEEREKGVAAIKAAKRAEEERIFRQIEAGVKEKLAAENRLLQMRELLWEEEAERRRIEQDEARKAKVLNMRNEMIEANEYQKKLKKEMKAKERQFELELIKKMQVKFDEDTAQAKAKEDARLQQRKEYISAIEQQNAQKREMYFAEVDREAKHSAMIKEREQFRERVVAEARKRILAN